MAFIHTMKQHILSIDDMLNTGDEYSENKYKKTLSLDDFYLHGPELSPSQR